MDFDKYLFPGSPFLRTVSTEIRGRIVDSIIQGQQWPQDAIAGELLDDFLATTYPTLAFSYPKRDRRIARLKPGQHDIVDFSLGYTTPLFAINIAIRAYYDLDEKQTERYITHRLKDETGYLLLHLTALKNTFASDKTCADIFKYVAESPPTRGSDFCQLGIESARLEFGGYSIVIMGMMQEQLGPVQTARIWGQL